LGYQISVRYRNIAPPTAGGGVGGIGRDAFGSFIEIEAPGRSQIQAAAARLGLDWSALHRQLYGDLERLKQHYGLSVHDLTFDQFARGALHGALGLRPAGV
jgi:N-formylglutamate amidohydrolase